MGSPLARLLRSKLIYHNEGFYPDEQVDGGVWRSGSLPHRVARALEQRLYARADGIIALSHRARQVIEDLPAVRRRATPTIVVPSCVNLDLFRAPQAGSSPDQPAGPVPQVASAARPQLEKALRLVYIGSIGYRYIFDRVARFAAVAHDEIGPVRLRVLTK